MINKAVDHLGVDSYCLGVKMQSYHLTSPYRAAQPRPRSSGPIGAVLPVLCTVMAASMGFLVSPAGAAPLGRTSQATGGAVIAVWSGLLSATAILHLLGGLSAWVISCAVPHRHGLRIAGSILAIAGGLLALIAI